MIYLNTIKNCLQRGMCVLRYALIAFACLFVGEAFCASSSSSSSSSSSPSSSSSSTAAPAQTPLFLTAVAKPHVALVMSVDQELSKKAYSDYANLDGNTFTLADTTYRDNFDYYGYFDSSWCYTYVVNTSVGSSYFTPYAAATKPTGATYNAHQCAGTGGNIQTEEGAWSGNFLNWATMTRMDILRKVLFGGKRSVDTATSTILERAYLPRDIHAFSKQYSGTDVNKYTPYAYVSELTPLSLCNVSSGSGTTGYPLMRLARAGGKYLQWASSEGAQCQAGKSTTPSAGDIKDFVVKVNSCVTGKDGDASQRCRQYGTSTLKKPAGLLQKYGEDGGIKFSLTTGSYKAHTKGGVVRVGASLIANNTVASNDEISLSTGIFNSSVNGIIKNINSIKIANYDWTAGNYSDCSSPGISVATVLASNVSDGATTTCTDWGNPIAEVYLEMLRYISGKTTPSSGFAVNDSTAIGTTFKGVNGVTYLSSSWADPWTEWCATCSAIIISTGANSFDGDDLGSAADIAGLTNAASVLAKTDTVGAIEAKSLYGDGATFAGDYFMGGTGADRYCSTKPATNFSDIKGICPELPGLEGTYNITGLAYHAHITDLRPDLTTVGSIIRPGKRNLNTYAVDLAESVPTFKVKVGSQEISFIPTCQSSNGVWGSCTLIDVIVEDLKMDTNGNPASGKYLITWEDSNWGNDYDLDAAQRLEFCVGATACSALGINNVDDDQIHITNSVVSAQAGFPLKFSYSIYGVKAASGKFFNNPAEDYIDTTFNGGTILPWIQRPGGQNFNIGEKAPDTVGYSKIKFTAGTQGAVRSLNKPLWYAAKYGGFVDSNANDKPDLVSEWDNYHGASDGVPDNFFNVSNPSLLESSLENVFISILEKTGSASAVATSSTRLAGNDFVYQATFESKSWTSQILAYQPDEQGQLPTNPTYKTTDSGRMSISKVGRNIYTYNAGTVSFDWDNLNASQQAALTMGSESLETTKARIEWIKGDGALEDNASGFRKRSTSDGYHNILGDIVNSGPVYAGYYDYGFNKLATGGSAYADYLTQKRKKVPLLLVGANDGMLHAFIGNSNPKSDPVVTSSDVLKEKFAYIPSVLFSKIIKLSKPDYGNNVTNPHQYMVDGAIAVSDVYINGDWRTIAVGSLGAGGKTVYGLDITDPNNPTILFEYTDTSIFGNVLGKIYIAPARDGNWYAIFGNGAYGGASKLVMLKLDSPFTQTVKIINTGSGAGLTSPSILLDAQGQITDAYSGDLSGNMWHFDLANTSPVSWGSYKVFSANANQPITASPTIGYNSITQKIMVYFGTGKYFDTGDNLFINAQQSFYAVPDNGASGTPETRSNLYQQILTTSYTAGAETRAVAWTKPWGLGSQNQGWYFDLSLDSSAGRGERITAKALLIQDRLLITTLIPSQKTCESGGQSWLFEVPAVGDKYVNNYPPFEPIYNQELYLGDQNPVVGVSKAATSSASSAASSSASSAAPCQTMNASLINAGSGGTLSNNSIPVCAGNTGRQSWRQLR